MKIENVKKILKKAYEEDTIWIYLKQKDNYYTAYAKLIYCEDDSLLSFIPNDSNGTLYYVEYEDILMLKIDYYDRLNNPDMYKDKGKTESQI